VVAVGVADGDHGKRRGAQFPSLTQEPMMPDASYEFGSKAKADDPDPTGHSEMRDHWTRKPDAIP
jgi:hypothetical protein